MGHNVNGEYVKDGIPYCSVCHTPKQLVAEIYGIEHRVSCVCLCARELMERQDEEARLAERVEAIYAVGLTDKRLRASTFSVDDAPTSAASKRCRAYAARWSENREAGTGLTLYGPVGSGKTFYAACVANKLIQQGVNVKMTNFAAIAAEMQKSWNRRDTYLNELNRVDLLVVDDLAAERETEYMNEVVFSIIDGRYRAMKPLIVTTNLTDSELLNPDTLHRQRIFSRLAEMSTPVLVAGRDRRKDTL